MKEVANKKIIVKIVLWTMLICSIMIIYLGLLSPIDNATGRDLKIVRLQYVVMGVLMFIATLLHMNSEKIAFLRGKLIKTICIIWGSYFFSIIIFIGITQMMLTSEYQQYLVNGQLQEESSEVDLAKLEKDQTDDLPTSNSDNENTTTVESIENDDGVIKSDNSIYSRLNDEEFIMLVKLVSKSFYSFNIAEEEYNIANENPNIVECLPNIYDYAYTNYWELDPVFSDCFTERWNEELATNNHEITNDLENSFDYSLKLDLNTKEWKYKIESYSFNSDELIKYNNEYYVDADGYVGKGVVLYSYEGEDLAAVAEIKDIQYNKEIEGGNGTFIVPFGIFIEYYGDEAYWKDGKKVLRSNKSVSGEPLYYVKVSDSNRTIKKDEY